MAYSLVLGPGHPFFPEPLQVELKVERNRIVGARVQVGFGYRGIESRATTVNLFQALHLVEHTCGCCSFASSLAFAQAVEDAVGMAVPLRARYIRTLMAELERVATHFAQVALTCQAIGFETMAMRLQQLREHVLDISEGISGNRIHAAMNEFGGVRSDVVAPVRIAGALRKLSRSASKLVRSFIHDEVVASRMIGVGVIGPEEAQRIGLLGPNLRACGLDHDIRREVPYAAYGYVEVGQATQTGGDVFARTMVRLLEALESVRIIEQLAEQMPPGEYRTQRSLRLGAGHALTRVEAPVGEQFQFVVTDGSDAVRYLKLHSASLNALNAIEYVLPGQDVADVPAIIASLGFGVACAER